MTVTELILILENMPASADIVIQDADTHWLLGKPTATYDGADNRVVIESSYGRRVDK